MSDQDLCHEMHCTTCLHFIVFLPRIKVVVFSTPPPKKAEVSCYRKHRFLLQK